MGFSKSLRAGVAVALLAFVTAPAVAQTSGTTDYVPQVGQEGKDVIWVPTPQTLVDKMLDIAEAKPGDYVIDLGSGDGRTVITAAKRGIKALGIEYNPKLVELSKRAAEKEGVGDKAQFVQGDIFKTDFSQATVLTMFLLTELNYRLRPTILEMKPGTRVVSNTFDMGDWSPDGFVRAEEDCQAYCRAYFWVVPAKVGGTWRMGEGELALEQTYQKVRGTLTVNGKPTGVEGSLRGDQITLKAGDREYTGKVSGDTIEGAGWRATRQKGA